MALPNPSMSFSPFAILTAEEMNDIVENIESLASGSGFNSGAIDTEDLADDAITAPKLDSATFCSFAGTSNQSLVAGTDTILNITEQYDDSSSVSSGVFTVPVKGQYTFSAGAGITNTTGRLELRLQVNGVTIGGDGARGGAAVDDPTASVTRECRVNAGDLVRVQVNSPDGSATLDATRTFFTGSLRFSIP